MTQADIVFQGGRIFCGLKEGFVQAMAIANGKVLAVGDESTITALCGPDTEVVDLEGRIAIPGLNDAHMHLLPLGMGMSDVNLRPESGVRSLAEVFSRIEAVVKQKQPGEWVNGRGYDESEFVELRHPTLEELDRIAPNNPVFIKRTCGHVSVANSYAMRLAGIADGMPQPQGGLIEQRDGKLTGLLAERAQRLISDVLPKPTRAQLVDCIEKAGRYMLTQGFTSVMDAAVGMNVGMEEVHAYEEAEKSGRLPVRTWVSIYGNPDGIAEQAYKSGYRNGRGSDESMLRFGAMKVFGDGSAGGLTAAMSEPYLIGDPANRGIFCFPEADMHRMLKHFHEQGYQLAIHGIGDAAIEQVLSGMEKASSDAQPILGRRHRIEHCGFLTPDQRARMKAAGIDPVPQPLFVYEFGDRYLECVGPERAAASYPMHTWLAEGQHAAASSDAPVCTTDPFKNLYTMVTRKTNRGTVVGESERLTMEQAVHAYTYNGAYTQFAENVKGRLIPGQVADIAVLSHDIFSCDPNALENDVQCDITFLNGERVYDRVGHKVATPV